jgi:hypothetical protein
MSQDHRLQQQRFELKFLVEESLTPLIRDFVGSHLELDDFGAGRPNFSYPVHSVYLDSDDLHTHHASVNGTKNRFKLRLRYYNDQPGSAVFCEVKARVDNCILKRRCGVRRGAVEQLLNGHWPRAEQFFTTEPRHFAALERFLFLMQSLNAQPRAHNTYLREAWVSPHDNSVRVTFDREVFIEPHFDLAATVPMREPVAVYPAAVILELKFTDRFPNWFNHLVQRFDLMRSSAAKYSGGILLCGEASFRETVLNNAPFGHAEARGVEEMLLAEL